MKASDTKRSVIKKSKPRSWLWLWFVAAFAVQAAVWATWFTIAAHHQVQTVPLVQTR